MSEDLRSRVAAEIRRDLQEEAEAGFPLLRRFPDSETAGVPAFVSGLSAAERDGLFDALAQRATLELDYQQREALAEAQPNLKRLRNLRPVYPDDDWYGGRPKKAKLKRAVADKLAATGFARRKREPNTTSDWMEFARPDSAFPGGVGMFFDPGFPRQIDYGYRDWLRPELLAQFPPLGPRNIIPALTNLNYEVLWRCGTTSNPICWDVITEANLEETLDVLVETLDRLGALAERVNALEAPL